MRVEPAGQPRQHRRIDKQQQFQEQTFQTVALPFYAIFDADGKPLATFPGLTRNPNEFVDFLKKSGKN